MTTQTYIPRHPVVFKDPDDGIWRWLCAECTWSVELDTQPGAYRQVVSHYIGRHLLATAPQPWVFLGWF